MEAESIPEYITSRLDTGIYALIARHSIDVWRLFSLVSGSMSKMFNMQSRLLFFPRESVRHTFNELSNKCVCGNRNKFYLDYEERPWFLQRKKICYSQYMVGEVVEEKPLMRGVRLGRRDHTKK